MYDDRSTGSLSDHKSGSTSSENNNNYINWPYTSIAQTTPVEIGTSSIIGSYRRDMNPSERYDTRAAIANAQRVIRPPIPTNTTLGNSNIPHGTNNYIIGTGNKVYGDNNIVVGQNQTVRGNNNSVFMSSDSETEHKGDNMLIFGSLPSGELATELASIRKEMAQLKEMIEELQYAPPSTGGPLFKQGETSFLTALKATQASKAVTNVTDVTNVAKETHLSDATKTTDTILPLDADL